MRNRLTGLALPYNKPCLLPDGTMEVIKPGAVADILRRRDKVMLVIEHTPPLAIASTLDGTLSLTDMADGLHFAVEMPPITYANDWAELIKRNRRSIGCSFHMNVQPSGMTYSTMTTGRRLRTITRINAIREITLTWSPAYESTYVALEQIDDSGSTSASNDGGEASALLTYLKIRERM